MTKYTRITWDAAKKLWILPDGTTTPSFDWDKFKSFGDHLDFRTVNKPTLTKEALSSISYYEKYYGRRSRPNKVDKVLDTLVGVERKMPLTPVNRVIIKKMVSGRLESRSVIKKSSSNI